MDKLIPFKNRHNSDSLKYKILIKPYLNGFKNRQCYGRCSIGCFRNQRNRFNIKFEPLYTYIFINIYLLYRDFIIKVLKIYCIS